MGRCPERRPARAWELHGRPSYGRLIILASVLLLTLWTGDVRAAEKWYVEFSQGEFEESQIRRAVALELREVEIPGNPERPDDGPLDVSLRILITQEGDFLEVSLWDRGEYAGRRRVSHGTESRILARRVGLAVGELGRQLAGQRERGARKLRREALAFELSQKKLRRERRLRDMTLRAGGSSLWVPQGAWLLGPRLGFEFNEHYPVRVVPEVSWMAGPVVALSDATLGKTAPEWSMFDLSLAVKYALALRPDSSLDLGGLLGVGTVHLSGASSVDGILGQRDTWTARGAFQVGFSRRITDDVRFHVDLAGGSFLRRIPITYGATDLRLGGGFVGIDFGVVLARREDDGSSPRKASR